MFAIGEVGKQNIIPANRKYTLKLA